jgi:GTP-binding protein HflX
LFFDRPETGEVAILVHLEIESDFEQEDPQEFEELVLSAGGDPAEYLTGSRKKPTPNYFVGTGKLQEIEQAIAYHNAQLVIFNHTLSPSQERNLESNLKCRVLDRTGLILDIFAQRARSHEGKLQVELAQLQHLSTRLKRGWTHLDRQKGGIGLRGAGETQLELDQRMVRQRIKSINKGLSKVRAQRSQGRRSRKKAEVPTISLVGYTNAGKSSVFNTLTNAGTYAADQLRAIDLPSFGNAVLADTVGFISHLPHQLVEAFRATLEETAEANLLLHVVDAANEQRNNLMDEVDSVLAEIGAENTLTLQVFNKIDLIDGRSASLDRDSSGRPVRVWVSAKTGEGMDLLLLAVSEMLDGELVQQNIVLLPEHARLRSRLYDKGAVQEETIDGEGQFHLQIKLGRNNLQRIIKEEGLQMDANFYVNKVSTEATAAT